MQRQRETTGPPATAASVLVLSGGGPHYDDPWHPFAETSAAIAGILGGQPDLAVTVTDDVVDALEAIEPDGSSAWELIVVNFGSAGVPTPHDAASLGALERHVAAGNPLLVCHVASTLFPADDRWEHLLGGRWVRDVTMHPPSGDAEIRVDDPGHPVTVGLTDFVLIDERYSYLRVSPESAVLASHEHDELRHPLLWVRERGRARIVYDALGHDARSFDSSEHARLLTNAARWLLRES